MNYFRTFTVMHYLREDVPKIVGTVQFRNTMYYLHLAQD